MQNLLFKAGVWVNGKRVNPGDVLPADAVMLSDARTFIALGKAEWAEDKPAKVSTKKTAVKATR